MQDVRLVAARKLVWDKDAWRAPAYIALVLSGLKEILGNEAETPVAHAEAEMLTKKLYVASKAPPRG